MGILGLTHDDNGGALEKLPVRIKVAIGEGPEPGSQNGHPRRLDHFVFKRKTLRGQDVVWEPAPEIAKLYGEKPTELGIIFLMTIRESPPDGIRLVDAHRLQVPRRPGADRERERAEVRDAGGPTNAKAPRRRAMAGQLQIHGGAKERPTGRTLRRRLPRSRAGRLQAFW